MFETFSDMLLIGDDFKELHSIVINTPSDVNKFNKPLIQIP